MPQDKTPKDLESLRLKAKSARMRLEPEWYMNLAYYGNQQWLAWDGRQLYTPAVRKGRITHTDNRLTGVIEIAVAKITKQRPIFQVAPDNEDQSASNAAMMAEQIMRYLWTHLHLSALDRKALEWAQVCGAGFFKVMWDPSIGPSASCLTDPGGQPITDPSSGALVGPQHPLAPALMERGATPASVCQGDVRVEVRSPFQMFVDPLCDSFHEAEWLVEESVKSKDSLLQRYGSVAEKLKADKAANPGLIEARMGQVYQPGSPTYKGVSVKEYWCKPNRDHPDGYRCVWAQDQVLYEDEKPFDPFPYVMLSGVPSPGRLWPMSRAELLRGPQTQLNKLVSQITENINRVGNPTLLFSKQAVQDPENFLDSTMMPGGAYAFDETGSTNAVPSYLEAPPLPQYVTSFQANILDSIQDIAGQHDVNQAQTPAGVTAASAINLLQEADDTRLGPAITDHEINLGILGKKILQHVSKFYTDARMVRIPGDNGTWEIFDFRGSQIPSDPHVSVQAGSAFPQSKAAKQAMIQEMLNYFVQSGQPLQGRALGQWLRDVEVGGLERLIEQLSVDEGQVDRENALMYQGVVVQLNVFDNDTDHIEGHEDEMKSARFANSDPQVQNIFLTHLAAHQERNAQAQQQQMMAQQQMQNPGGPQDQQAQQQQQGLDQATQIAQTGQQLADSQQSRQQQASGAQQQQRQAEEKHQQAMRHAEEAHQANLAQRAQQPSNQQSGGNGRR